MRLIVWLRRRAPWPIEIELAEYAATGPDTHALVLIIIGSPAPILFDDAGAEWQITISDVLALAVIEHSRGE